MKATILAVGLVFEALVAAAPAQAQTYCPNIPVGPPPFCWYQQNYYGQWFGPNCYVAPPFPPFQGMVFPPPRPPGVPGSPGSYSYGPGGPAAFPTHPWMRSPRDFFMWE